jgi:RNA polymerase sigma-70 factor (ECF subfamily)
VEDERIIELFFERSEQAIGELSRKYGRLCLKVSENILGNAEDAEECVNDAYLALWNRIPPERPDPLASYLIRIVRNLSVKRYHANTAAKRNSHYDVALSELEECFPSGRSVEEEIEARETAGIIDGFLGSLNEPDRVLFVRRYYHGDSIEDLAKLFSTTKHNVSVRLSRIRKKLKQILLREGVSL